MMTDAILFHVEDPNDIAPHRDARLRLVGGADCRVTIAHADGLRELLTLAENLTVRLPNLEPVVLLDADRIDDCRPAVQARKLAMIPALVHNEDMPRGQGKGDFDSVGS